MGDALRSRSAGSSFDIRASSFPRFAGCMYRKVNLNLNLILTGIPVAMRTHCDTHAVAFHWHAAAWVPVCPKFLICPRSPTSLAYQPHPSHEKLARTAPCSTWRLPPLPPRPTCDHSSPRARRIPASCAFAHGVKRPRSTRNRRARERAGGATRRSARPPGAPASLHPPGACPARPRATPRPAAGYKRRVRHLTSLGLYCPRSCRSSRAACMGRSSWESGSWFLVLSFWLLLANPWSNGVVSSAGAMCSIAAVPPACLGFRVNPTRKILLLRLTPRCPFRILSPIPVKLLSAVQHYLLP